MIALSKIQKLVSEHGDCESQSSDLWDGDITLPDEIENFYKDIGPMGVTITSFGNPIYFPSLKDLWSFQEGYRWNSLTGEPIEGWDSNWIVIANEGGDPYIFIDGKVYFTFHGQGAWDPELMYPNMNTVIACISTLGKIMNDAGVEFEDEDGYVNKECYDKAVSEIALFLDSKKDAEDLIERYGWE